MPSVGIEPVIPGVKRLQTHTLHCMSIKIGLCIDLNDNWISCVHSINIVTNNKIFICDCYFGLTFVVVYV